MVSIIGQILQIERFINVLKLAIVSWGSFEDW
jgi:hypothetical protein